MFECVQICTVSDALHALQRPAACTIFPARPVWYRVQTCAACPASGRVCRCVTLPALHLVRPALLPVMCRPSGCAGVLGSPPLGYMGRAGGVAVDTSRRKNSKKAFFLPTNHLFSAQNTPPLLPISKISRKNKKTPTKGLCSVLYLPYKP